MTPQDEESTYSEYDVGEGDNDAELNDSIQFLEVESTADRNVSFVNVASANKDPLGNGTADHSAKSDSETSIEWLEVKSVSDGGALDDLASCVDGAVGYSADHENADRFESSEIEHVVDAQENVSIKDENFNMARMRVSLESVNNSDCVIVAEYRETEEEVDDTGAE